MSNRPEWRVEHREALALITEYVDDRLPEATRREFAAHLETCAECRTLVAEEGRLKQMLAALPVVDVPRPFTLSRAPRPMAAPVWLRPVRWATGLAAAVFLVVLGLNAFTFGPAAAPAERAASSQSIVAPQAATQTALEAGASTPVVAGAQRKRTDPTQPDIFEAQSQPATAGVREGLRVALIATGAVFLGLGAAWLAGWWRQRDAATG